MIDCKRTVCENRACICPYYTNRFSTPFRELFDIFDANSSALTGNMIESDDTQNMIKISAHWTFSSTEILEFAQFCNKHMDIIRDVTIYRATDNLVLLVYFINKCDAPNYRT